jgi:hypothetical protein
MSRACAQIPARNGHATRFWQRLWRLNNLPIADGSARTVRAHVSEPGPSAASPFNVRCTHSSNAASLNGLLRKQTAPPFIARSRMRSSGNAVMRITGIFRLCAIRWSCRSRPLIPGISTSVTMQTVSFSRGEARNSFADANASVANPIDVNKRAIAPRTEASSSMIEITWPRTRPTFFRERF